MTNYTIITGNDYSGLIGLNLFIIEHFEIIYNELQKYVENGISLTGRLGIK